MRSVIAYVKSLFRRIIALFSRKENDPAEIDRPEPGPGGEVVCYYGCPNSNKAKKLQLSKKAVR